MMSPYGPYYPYDAVANTIPYASNIPYANQIPAYTDIYRNNMPYTNYMQFPKHWKKSGKCDCFFDFIRQVLIE